MKAIRGFTKDDILVVSGCVVFVLANLGAIGSGGRERAKRAICLNNLRQLTLAWMQYADDNGDKIVSGSAGFPDCSPGGSRNIVGVGCENPWVDYSRLPLQVPEYLIDEKAAIMGEEYTRADGTIDSFHKGRALLWQYVKNLNLYRCPTGLQKEWREHPYIETILEIDLRTYSIADAMNGAAAYFIDEWEAGGDIPEIGRNIRIRAQIERPGERFVFVDEGHVTVDSWTVYYDRPEWFDPPPSRHGNGTNWSFADGHSEYHKWTDRRTLEYAEGVSDPYQECNQDLYWVQYHAWGELGYEPECPPEF